MRKRPQLHARVVEYPDPMITIADRGQVISKTGAALFLDRDGVINDNVPYNSNPENVKLTKGVGQAIAKANLSGIPVAIVTNQSGIGRGFYSWTEFWRVQDRIEEELYAFGARIDLVLACGWHANEGDNHLRPLHPWRKPRPGMIMEGLLRLKAHPRESAMIGDSRSDVEAGLAAGLGRNFLVCRTDGSHPHCPGQDLLGVITSCSSAHAINSWLADY